jgi:hypothetical protein
MVVTWSNDGIRRERLYGGESNGLADGFWTLACSSGAAFLIPVDLEEGEDVLQGVLETEATANTFFTAACFCM